MTLNEARNDPEYLKEMIRMQDERIRELERLLREKNAELEASELPTVKCVCCGEEPPARCEKCTLKFADETVKRELKARKAL